MGMFIMSGDRQKETAAHTWYREPKAQTPTELTDAVNDYAWQMFRGCSLKGKTTESKLELLHHWLSCWQGTPYERLAVTQVINYLGALKRGGFIREPNMTYGPDAYRAKHTPGLKFFEQVWLVVK